MIVHRDKARQRPEFFTGGPGCWCCATPPPLTYYPTPYYRQTITLSICQSCFGITLPANLTLTIVKLDSDCPCMSATTRNMVFRDTFTHPQKEANPLGPGVSCTINSAWGTETSVQDCDRTLFGLTATSFVHFYFQSLSPDTCKLQMALIGASSCSPTTLFRNSSAVRVISCSPLNMEFDFDLGGRGGYVDGGLCSNPSITAILTE